MVYANAMHTILTALTVCRCRGHIAPSAQSQRSPLSQEEQRSTSLVISRMPRIVPQETTWPTVGARAPSDFYELLGLEIEVTDTAALVHRS